MSTVELEIDVSAAAGIGEPASIALTVEFDLAALADVPIVCFAKPGAGFTRQYYTMDLPGRGSGAQSSWHTSRGWIFVAVDHLGVGGSSTDHDPSLLTFATLSTAAVEAERAVLDKLRSGTLHADLPALPDLVVIGIGQSMGGAMTIVQQGRYHCYDGIASLGYSAVRTHPPTTPGSTPMVAPWHAWDAVPGTKSIVLNQAAYEAAEAPWEDFAAELRWHFFYDDPDELCGPALAYLATDGVERPWLASEFPGTVVEYVLTPGIVAGEAAAVTTPVLVARGERDDIPDPPGEARAYLSAASIDLFMVPKAGHMHNFAETREILWQRIANWADWVRMWRASNPR